LAVPERAEETPENDGKRRSNFPMLFASWRTRVFHFFNFFSDFVVH
jgi:hypothetical protein